MASHDLPHSDDERARYEQHNNDVENKGYQRFVQPIVEYIKTHMEPDHSTGLDFGAGTGPVIAKLLREAGYTVNLYDPFFHPHDEYLNQSYDYIIACEVVEHFHRPKKEFALLRKLLKSGGHLVLMTDLLPADTAFQEWYYKNDETHVFFYHPDTFETIRSTFGFQSLSIHQRLVVLSI
jgi:2-polyprenyl-3-methyl-5-hydroxy-6-metoxy-1,4-benzoquinol methylase